MSELRKTIKAHFIHEDGGVFAKLQINFAPRAGDELRFSGERYFTVTRLVWVYDEPEAEFSRLNIGIVTAPTPQDLTKPEGLSAAILALPCEPAMSVDVGNPAHRRGWHNALQAAAELAKAAAKGARNEYAN